MRRRQLLAIATASVAGIFAGCATVFEDVGLIDETLVRETVFTSQSFAFDLEAGDEISIEVENESGWFTAVELEGPDGEILLEYTEVETTDEFDLEAEETGVHRIFVYPSSEGSVHVTRL